MKDFSKKGERGQVMDCRKCFFNHNGCINFDSPFFGKENPPGCKEMIEESRNVCDAMELNLCGCQNPKADCRRATELIGRIS